MEQAGPTSTWGGQKFRRDILGVRSPSPTLGPRTQGSSPRKISPQNFWLQKPVRIESVEKNFWRPKQFLLKNPHMDSLTQTQSL